MMSRQAVLDHYRNNPEVAVLIIGAGVNGIGTFRDLAMQGVDVLMVDKGDFCSGTSAASSHMLHGGIRYLENAEFRLVREALHERNRLLENAPHYAKPLKTSIPIFSWLSGTFNAPLKFLGIRDKPGERGALVIKLGLMMYDWFIRKHRNMPKHDFLLYSDAIHEYPKINPDILCIATYYDAWMPTPERICIDMIHDAEALSDNVHALNYVTAIDGGINQVTLKDEITGDTLAVRPKLVINAAGPWIDFVNRAMGIEKRFIGGTKGSHLVLDHPELHDALNGGEVFFENEDGRIVLLFPFVERVMAGTTDIRIDNPDEARCTEEEVDYILGMVDKVFPTIDVGQEHIVFRFSGVRPLPHSDASTTGQISRDHSINVVEPNDEMNFPIYSLVGGKWTTFRAFAEQTTDKSLDYLKRPRQTSTADVAIGGGKDYPKSDNAKAEWIHKLADKTELDTVRITTLFERYGTRAEHIAEVIADTNDSPLTDAPDYSRREVQYIMETEKVRHLDDFVLRRSLLAMLGYVTADMLDDLVDILGGILDWDDTQKQAELQRTKALLADEHEVLLSQQTD